MDALKGVGWLVLVALVLAGVLAAAGALAIGHLVWRVIGRVLHARRGPTPDACGRLIACDVAVPPSREDAPPVPVRLTLLEDASDAEIAAAGKLLFEAAEAAPGSVLCEVQVVRHRPRPPLHLVKS